MTFKINLSLIFCRLTVETGGNGIVFEEKKLTSSESHTKSQLQMNIEPYFTSLNSLAR